MHNFITQQTTANIIDEKCFNVTEKQHAALLGKIDSLCHFQNDGSELKKIVLFASLSRVYKIFSFKAHVLLPYFTARHPLQSPWHAFNAAQHSCKQAEVK